MSREMCMLTLIFVNAQIWSVLQHGDRIYSNQGTEPMNLLIDISWTCHFVKITDYDFRPKMKSSSSILLIALAVADTLVLWVGLPEHFIAELYGINLATLTKYSCGFYYSFHDTFKHAAVWFLVNFTIFRAISTCVPHKAYILCSKKRAYFQLLLLFLWHSFLDSITVLLFKW